MIQPLLSVLGTIVMSAGFLANFSPFSNTKHVTCQVVQNAAGSVECAGMCKSDDCDNSKLGTYIDSANREYAFCSCDDPINGPPPCCHTQFEVDGKM